MTMEGEMFTEHDLKRWREKVRRQQTGAGDPRVTKAVDRVLDALFPAILEAKPTLEEWFAFLDFIGNAGAVQIKGIAWILGITQIVEELNSPLGPDATDQCVEGPFHRPGAKTVPSGAPLFEVEDTGDYLFFEGRVLDTKGKPLSGVEIDVWGTNGTGTYSFFDPSQPEFNCRGKVKSAADGRYSILTKFPQPYTVEFEAMGTVIRAMGHQPWRPAHLHFKLDQPGYEPLTTQICFKGHPYIENDAALAVKDHLVVDLVRHESDAALKKRGVQRPFYSANFDFRLQPLQGERARA
jgi:hydroxyquinol 1,2-dioxygenase